MNKLFTVSVAALALGIGLVGCDLLPTDVKESETAKVTMNMPDTLQLSTTTPITGKIDADENITGVQYSILNSSGAVATGVTVNGPSVSGDKAYEFKAQILTITVGPNATAGTYQLQLVVTAGPVATVAFPFYVKGTTTVVEDALKEKQVTLGNQNALAGSALDVDLMEVYGSSQFSAASVQATIDLWFGIVTGNVAKMMAPSVANGFAPVKNNWTTKNDTKILKSTAVFSQITTQSQINALWNDASAVSSAEIAANDVFVIKTAQGNYRLLKIFSASTSEAGNVIVVGKIK